MMKVISILTSTFFSLYASAYDQLPVVLEDEFFYTTMRSLSLSLQYGIGKAPTKRPATVTKSLSPAQNQMSLPSARPVTSSSIETNRPSISLTPARRLTSKPSSARPATSVSSEISRNTSLLSVLSQEGSGIKINGELPDGMNLAYFPDGYSGIDDFGASTEAPFVYKQDSNETIRLSGGNLPNGTELVLIVANSSDLHFHQIGSRIKIDGSIPSGATLEYRENVGMETSGQSDGPFLYKEIAWNTSLISGGNIPSGAVIYLSASTVELPPESITASPTNPPSTAKPSSSPNVLTSSLSLTTSNSTAEKSTLQSVLSQEGSSIKINGAIPDGANLGCFPNGYSAIDGYSVSTEVPYVYKQASNETILIRGGNLFNGSEIVLAVANSSDIQLHQIGSIIQIDGNIPSGATFTYHEGSSAETSSQPDIPFLYKEIAWNTSLISAGNLPDGSIIYLSTSRIEAS